MLGSYQNHYYENGTVFRGDQTRRVILPDADGVYKIQYQQKVFYHTLEELLGVKVAQTHIQLPGDRKKAPSPKLPYYPSKVCDEYGVSITAFKGWMVRNGYNPSLLLPGDEWRGLLDKRKEMIRETRYKTSHAICGRAGVNHNGYKSHLRMQGIFFSSMTPEKHEKEVLVYREKMISKGKL